MNNPFMGWDGQDGAGQLQLWLFRRPSERRLTLRQDSLSTNKTEVGAKKKKKRIREITFSDVGFL